MGVPGYLKNDLYGEDEVTGRVFLVGGKCACGHLCFPYQNFGCERCGALHVERVRLPAEGVLRASARVHRHRGEREAPFVVGSIVLDAGPLVRTLLACSSEDLPPRPGVRVAGCFREAKDAANETVRDLRFRVVSGGGQ